MVRDLLYTTNTGIVRSVTMNIIQHSPEAIIVIVSNPLDVMTYCAFLAAGIPSQRVFGMAGILDTARYRAFLAEALDCSPKDIQAVRSEERRVGKECVSTCSSRWSPYH